jgi:hypothetical protein
MLDFGKTEEVFLQAAPAIDLLRKQLKGVAIENGTLDEKRQATT